MVDDVQLPHWRWDDRTGALSPCCPKCEGTVRADGSKLSCLVMGYSHYSARIADVREATLRRLASP